MFKGFLSAKRVGNVCHGLVIVFGKSGSNFSVFQKKATAVTKPHTNEAISVEHSATKRCAISLGGTLLDGLDLRVTQVSHLAFADRVLGKILTNKPIPLAEDVELQIVLNLLGGVLAKGERFGFQHCSECGKRGKFAPLVRTDIDLTSVTVASGNECALSVRIRRAEILTDLTRLYVRVSDRGHVEMLDHILITTSPSITSGIRIFRIDFMYFLP